MTVHKARPDAPRWARAWPTGPVVLIMLDATGGSVVAIDSVAGGHVGRAVMVVGMMILAVWAVSNGWLAAIRTLPSTAVFSCAEHADGAADIWRKLNDSSLRVLADDTWFHLAAASRGGYGDAYSQLVQAAGRAIDDARRTSPERSEVEQFTAHVNALAQMLRKESQERG